jgi:hypothetical protein
MRLNFSLCSVRIALSPAEILRSLINMLDVPVWKEARQVSPQQSIGDMRAMLEICYHRTLVHAVQHRHPASESLHRPR